MRIAFGELGMTSNEFWDCTYREFFNRLYGVRAVNRLKEQAEWERARFTAIYAGLAGRTKKPLKEKDLKFSWEKANAKIYTEEERKRIREELVRTHGKHFDNGKK